jgi:hypothetical protein
MSAEALLDSARDVEDIPAPKSTRARIEHESPNCWAYAAFLSGIVGAVLLVRGYLTPERTEQMVDAICPIAGGVLYLLYWIEFFRSKCLAYLRHVMSESEFSRYVEKMQQNRPTIGFTIQNYHYETRTYTTTDRDGKRRTQTRVERVNTHFASLNYGIASQTDETLSPTQACAMFHLLNQSGQVGRSGDAESGSANFVINGHKSLIMTCHFPLCFFPRDRATHDDYQETRSTFYSRNTTDIHQDKKESHSVNDHCEFCIVVLSTGGTDSKAMPWWANTVLYFLSSVFFCGILFRWKLYGSTQKMTWDIAKHFSCLPPEEWTDADPISSLKFSADPVISQVHKLGKHFKISVEREESGESNGKIMPHEHNFSGVAVTVTMDPPMYWSNKDLDGGFDEFVGVPDATKAQLQKLLDDTWKNKATRDRRGGPLPKRLLLHSAHRCEDSKMWQRYREKQLEMAAKRPQGFSMLASLRGSGEAKTTKSLNQTFRARLDPAINELYLFHGTTPAGAFGIRENGFMMSKAGSNVGTMFGRGAYLAEASSKCDEYAQSDDTDLYRGLYAAILCRVSMGEMFYITESNIAAIDEALSSGEYDSVLGDREAPVGTYREFVAFDEAQIYPEFVLLYTREV